MTKDADKKAKYEDGFEMLAILIKNESDDIRSEMDKRFSAVDAKFDAIDEKFDAMDKRFDTMDARMDAMQNNSTHILSEVNYIRRRLDLLDEQFGNVKGFSKEIDDLRMRVKDVELQLALR